MPQVADGPPNDCFLAPTAQQRYKGQQRRNGPSKHNIYVHFPQIDDTEISSCSQPHKRLLVAVCYEPVARRGQQVDDHRVDWQGVLLHSQSGIGIHAHGHANVGLKLDFVEGEKLALCGRICTNEGICFAADPLELARCQDALCDNIGPLRDPLEPGRGVKPDDPFAPNICRLCHAPGVPSS